MSGPQKIEVVEQRGVMCPDCGSEMRLRDGPFRQFYSCPRFPRCRGSHGAHSDGRPLGVPGDEKTKAARKRAHAALKKIETLIGKSGAYRWLSIVMHVEPDECHIGVFDVAQCDRVVGAVHSYGFEKKGKRRRRARR